MLGRVLYTTEAHVLTSIKPFRHCIRTQQYNPESLARVFDLADQYRHYRYSGKIAGKLVATWFEEESTRTRFSFEAAIQRLGGRVISSADAAHFSSVAKGETLEDTIRVVGKYVDAIVLRHSDEDAADRAALVSDVPIINAGCGPHKDRPDRAHLAQHPTQALLDSYTIKQKFCELNNITIVFVGDLKNGRTVRSLVYVLSKYSNVRIMFVAPSSFAICEDIKDHLREHNIAFTEHPALTPEIVAQADVVYMTRVQKERFQQHTNEMDSERLMMGCTLTPQLVAHMKKQAIIMHPLPRNNELPISIDELPQAWYFKQAENGLYVRMALLSQILG
jgi:aspartate carbamoyltransferase catalytic subunit